MRDDPQHRARQFFQKQGFERFLEQVWKKYRALGRAGGNVVLRAATPEECEAVNSFFGTFYRPGETVKIPLKTLEKELQESPFPPTVPELYLALTGKPLLTRSELETLRESGWKAAFSEAMAELAVMSGETALRAKQWLKRLQAGETAGYRTLRNVYRTDPRKAEDLLLRVVKALVTISSGPDEVETDKGVIRLEMIRLPVLAARVTGDSHAFDWKEPAGRLLWHAIAEIWKNPQARRSPIPEDEWGDERDLNLDPLLIREGYRLAGIGDDDVSSLVHFYEPVPGMPAEPVVWTLRQVERAERVPRCSTVFVVENPAVFSALLDASRKWIERDGFRPSDSLAPVLVLSSGQPSAACYRVIERLLEDSPGGGVLRYSGDFDLSGLQIGISLSRRFPDVFRPWRMDAATYQKHSATGPIFSDMEIERLKKMKLHWDETLPLVMAQTGRKCFQELILGELLSDWLNAM